MSLDTNDPRLTAYALGELDDAERAEVEALLNESPQARAAVAKIRQTAELLTQELATEPVAALTAQQRDTIDAALRGDPPASTTAAPATMRLLKPWMVPTALAASIVLVAVGILIPSVSRSREQAKRSLYLLNTDPSATRDAVNAIPFASPRDSSPAVVANQGLVAGLADLGYAVDADGDGSFGTYDYSITDSASRDLYFADGGKSGRIPWASDILYPMNWPEVVAESHGSGEHDDTSQFYSANPVTRVVELSNLSAEDAERLVRELLQRRVVVRNRDVYDLSWKTEKGANSIMVRASQEDLAEVTAMIDSIESNLRRRFLLPNEGVSTEAYDPVVHNPFLAVMQNPLSTFSIDVDTASYANVRRFLSSGQLPPAGAVRIEEMVNYFDYDYPGPATAEAAVPHEDRAVPHEATAEAAVPHPFSVNVDIGEAPWTPEHRLMRVGLKGVEFEPEERPVCNLVFLIDVSGSMSDENKLPLVKEALDLLTQELWDDDRVAMVVYAGASGLVLDSTTGRDRDVIFDALARLDAGGSTNGGEGIQLAYGVAEEHFIEGGVNRVILATDGDFNVGITDQGDLVRLIEEKAQSGVFLSVLGFGIGNYKDDTLEKLADQGNGNYAYIDTLNEARKVLVEQLSGTLVTIAKDVKIQIEFNPAEVAAYRLIGYENRLLAAQDFNDDTKDAGEIGAGHTVTALYELVPAGIEVPAWEEFEGVTAPDGNPAGVGARADSHTSGVVIPTTEGRRDLAPSMDDTDDSDQIPRRFAPRNDSAPNGELSAQDGGDAATPPDPHAIAENDALPNIVDDEMVDPLKYQTPGNLAATALGISTGEVATVKLRYKLPDGDTSQLFEVPVIDAGATLGETSEDFRFAASVASFGMLLRDSPYRGGWTYDAVLELATESFGADVNGYRAEFVELVERARELAEK